jgi:murein hydrolase activator
MFRKQLNLKFQHIIVVLSNISCKTYKVSKSFIGLLFLLLTLSLSAQNKRGELEVKRQQLLKQIETTTLQLNKAQQTRTAARDKLEAVQTQLETREALINNLHEEIGETDNIISRTEEVLDALNEDINRLRIEYATMIRRAYKMKVPDNAILFMLSSNNFTEAYYKWQYFRMYDKFRKRQAKLITETQKAQKQTLIGANEQQRSIWEQEKQNKDKLIDELKNEEKRLSGELKSQEKQNLKINSSIERLISAELDAKRKAAEERQRKTQAEADRLALERTKEKKTKSRTNVAPETAAEKPRSGNIITESSENLALSSDFRNNKGKLPPPATGTIVRNFGKQHISDRLTAINNGIDIQTSSNADVKAVFTGNVSIISSIPGMGYVVLIQHGNYYTVYSNLSTVVVKKGQSVGTRQTIGYAGVNPVSNDSEVHFELWLERTHLNPTSWIAR